MSRGRSQRGPSLFAWYCGVKLAALAVIAPVAAVYVGGVAAVAYASGGHRG